MPLRLPARTASAGCTERVARWPRRPCASPRAWWSRLLHVAWLWAGAPPGETPPHTAPPWPFRVPQPLLPVRSEDLHCHFSGWSTFHGFGLTFHTVVCVRQGFATMMQAS